MQVISLQIKDNVHNHHGSICLLRLILVLKEILVFLDIKTYLENRRAGIKNLASNLNERSLPIIFCFNQVYHFFLFKYLQQLCTWLRHLFIHKELVFPFLFSFLFFLFLFYKYLISFNTHLHHISHQMIEIPIKIPFLS